MSNDITAQEIKDTRGKYGLSRKSFALLTGIGEASLARYETGGKPSKANANLIRAAANPRFMADCLKRDGGLLPEKQREKAEQIVYAMVYFDDEGEVMDINEMYTLTLEQELLSEHTANIMADVYRLEQEAKQAGDDVLSIVYEDILSYLARIKPMIMWRDYDSKEGVAELRGKVDAAAEIAARCRSKAA